MLCRSASHVFAAASMIAKPSLTMFARDCATPAAASVEGFVCQQQYIFDLVPATPCCTVSQCLVHPAMTGMRSVLDSL
ncbi:hypothetical protein BR93DRAFT_925351 [Coniochaeta sp. PMI_546]|nr:hypothetical protein BR93DRAFT_925351 [Coniochaeta sp. PMI_546]